MHGIKAAAGIGFLAGESASVLEVIAHAKQEDIDKLPEYLEFKGIAISIINKIIKRK